MKFDEYQEISRKTAIYPGKGTVLGLYYVGLGLGEAGEIQDKIKKIFRDDNGVLTDERRKQLGKEAGDLMWYLSTLADELGMRLGEIAENNVRKLQSRLKRGTIHGSGDNR